MTAWFNPLEMNFEEACQTNCVACQRDLGPHATACRIKVVSANVDDKYCYVVLCHECASVWRHTFYQNHYATISSAAFKAAIEQHYRVDEKEPLEESCNCFCTYHGFGTTCKSSKNPDPCPKCGCRCKWEK